MTKYSGEKSLDAEITLDFSGKNVTMDYSLNKFSSPYDSNHSMLRNEFARLPLRRKIFENAKSLGKALIVPPVILLSPLHTFCSEHQIIKNPNIHYAFQKTLKDLYVGIGGLTEQEKSGELSGTVLEFVIPHNLWFEYNLTGEYQDNIKTISLKRRYITRYIYGKFPKVIQSGWNVIFEFTEIPKSGSCIVRST